MNKDYIAGYKNQFLIGASYDQGNVAYGATSTLGSFAPQFVVNSLDILLTDPDEVSPRNLSTTNNYVGLYLSDTIDLTSEIALTVGGRYNFARVNIEDNTGNAPELNGNNTFQRFNPDGRRHLPAAPGGDGLCELRGSQSCTDAGRARLRRSGIPVLAGKLPDGRPAA